MRHSPSTSIAIARIAPPGEHPGIVLHAILPLASLDQPLFEFGRIRIIRDSALQNTAFDIEPYAIERGIALAAATPAFRRIKGREKACAYM